MAYTSVSHTDSTCAPVIFLYINYKLFVSLILSLPSSSSSSSSTWSFSLLVVIIFSLFLCVRVLFGFLGAFSLYFLPSKFSFSLRSIFGARRKQWWIFQRFAACAATWVSLTSFFAATNAVIASSTRMLLFFF